AWDKALHRVPRGTPGARRRGRRGRRRPLGACRGDRNGRVTGMDGVSGQEAGRLFGLRSGAVRDLAEQAEAVANACHAMALRFHQGGKLVVFGTGGASPDAQHVAVEFVHPVIVGKRALPAISLTTDVATVTGVAAREGMAGI